MVQQTLENLAPCYQKTCGNTSGLVSSAQNARRRAPSLEVRLPTLLASDLP